MKQGWQEKSAAAGSAVRRALRPPVLLAAALVLVVGSATALWAKSMVTPAYRVGNPSVAATSVSATASRTPTPSTTPSVTPTATKSATMASSGKFTTATFNQGPISSVGQLKQVAVRVETTAGLDPNTTAASIAATLNDPRSWTGDGSVRFGLVSDPAAADFTITISSPATSAKICSPVSDTCTTGTEVVVDALKWKTKAGTYSDATDWQRYLINHGVGAWLGKGVASCTQAGRPAPVMMAQAADLGGCKANPWPHP